MRKSREKEREEKNEKKRGKANERGTNMKKVGIRWDKEGKEGKQGRKKEKQARKEREREREMREKKGIFPVFRRSNPDSPRVKVNPRITGYS